MPAPTRSTCSSRRWAKRRLRHCGAAGARLGARAPCVELAPEGKLKTALELANKLGARHALIVGDNEIAAGAYALKNMQTGEQDNVVARAID